MEEFTKIMTGINEATSLSALDDVEEEMKNLQLDQNYVNIAQKTLETKRGQLIANERMVIANERMDGTYFVNAHDMWKDKPSAPPKDNQLLGSFAKICREATPSFYEKLVLDAGQPGKSSSLCDPNIDSLGSNSRYIKPEKDIFNNPVDNSKAHLFLDSKSCAPGWGHMAEGATGKIADDEDLDESTNEMRKNKIRLLRMMGSKSKDSKDSCLRRDLHNYLPLPASHREYYDGTPQLLIIPILTLDEIKGWNGESGYDALVVAASSSNMDASVIYRNILSNYDWNKFEQGWDESRNKNSNICERKEIDKALESLGDFITAQAHSLIAEIPQKLVNLATRKDSVNHDKNNKKIDDKNNKKKKGKRQSRDGRNSGSNLEIVPEHNQSEPSDANNAGNVADTKVWWDYEPLVEKFKSEGVPLPVLKDGNIGRVLKVKFEPGQMPLPDPWLLMAKAAVNYSFIKFNNKLLPACKPPPHESILQYEEALRRHEQLVRQRDIPSELTVPVTPGSRVANEEWNNSRVVTPEKESGSEEHNSWEYFDD